MGLAISLVATKHKEKVWFYDRRKWEGRTLSTSLATEGGCCIWYVEIALLRGVRMHVHVRVRVRVRVHVRVRVRVHVHAVCIYLCMHVRQVRRARPATRRAEAVGSHDREP